jgi:putative hydrolase of HD superfamily
MGRKKLDEKLEKQITFLLEIDKMKSILRRTYHIDGARHENDAEHSWHLALYAMTLAEYADEEIDISKVIKLVLVHDLVEVYAGDTYIYDEEGKKTQEKREKEAGEKLFALLPSEQAEQFHTLIEEFNSKKTPEARFAGALDRLQPLLHNYYSSGKSWQEHDIAAEDVRNVNASVADGSKTLWTLAGAIIDDAKKQGWLR